MKIALIYLHGFNSASVDAEGNLLRSKPKLPILAEFCRRKHWLLSAPNLDYRDFQSVLDSLCLAWNQYLDQGYQVIFMGSSLGGFTSLYLGMKTASQAIMINPALTPSQLLQQFIGLNQDPQTGQAYEWQMDHCQQFLAYEQALEQFSPALKPIILLDMADELIDSHVTVDRYHDRAELICFAGGSHSFEHMAQALLQLEALL